MDVMALYFTSIEERDIMVCFLVSQEMSDFPRKTQYPVVDFLIVGQLTESTSQNPINFKSFWVRNNKP